MTKIDYSRNAGLLDSSILTKSTLSFIGCGGAANLIENLAGVGVGRINIVEFDTVSKTNPATQGYGFDDIGKSKTQALEARIKSKNPVTEVNLYNKRYEELSLDEHAEIWKANIVFAMTDSFPAQALINKDALKNNTDAIFAICYIGCEAIEITGTFISEIVSGVGCHRCHTKARYDSYKKGFENPKNIPSHLFAAEYLNAYLGILATSRLHMQKGSSLPIANVARQFSAKPCIISRLGGPEYWAQNGEPFSNTPIDQLLFSTKQYGLDTPSSWVCPDCGTKGVVEELENSKDGTTLCLSG